MTPTIVVFALGSNSSGQLGIGHTEDVSVPTPVVFRPQGPNSPVITVAAGGNHALLLTQSGQLFCSGPAAAAGDDGSAAVFRPVDVAPVRLVAATWAASMLVLAATGRVLAVGRGDKGELGLGAGVRAAAAPTVIAHFPPPGDAVAALAAGVDHVVAVLASGAAFGWGGARHGQLGGPAVASVGAPRAIAGVGFRVRRALCGRNFTLLLGACPGELCVLGAAPWAAAAAVGEAVDWAEAGATWGGVCVRRHDGSVRAWGRARGVGGGPAPAPEGLPRVECLATGSEHVVALTSSQGVVAWGWNEHGNCGLGAEAAVAGERQHGGWTWLATCGSLPGRPMIDGVGAGCATSWIFAHYDVLTGESESVNAQYSYDEGKQDRIVGGVLIAQAKDTRLDLRVP